MFGPPYQRRPRSHFSSLILLGVIAVVLLLHTRPPSQLFVGPLAVTSCTSRVALRAETAESETAAPETAEPPVQTGFASSLLSVPPVVVDGVTLERRIIKQSTVPNALGRVILEDLIKNSSSAANGMGPLCANVAYKAALDAQKQCEKWHSDRVAQHQLTMSLEFENDETSMAMTGEKKSIMRYTYKLDPKSGEEFVDTSDEIRAGAKTNPKNLAAAIAGRIRESKPAWVTARGGNAINIVFKAMHIAQQYVVQGYAPATPAQPDAKIRVVPRMVKAPDQTGKESWSAEFWCYRL